MNQRFQRIGYLILAVAWSQCTGSVLKARAQESGEHRAIKNPASDVTQDTAILPASQFETAEQPHLRRRIHPLQTPHENEIVINTGVRVPLILRNSINTRTAKPGDSVYFETFYPIAQDNRVVIPMGSFMRGHIMESKRPGRIKGRGEIRISIDSLTFSNGYSPELRAIPSSADTQGNQRVDSQGKIRGPSGIGRDLATIGTTTFGGFYAGTYAGVLSAFTRDATLVGGGIGSGVGAVVGLGTILLTRGPEAELPRGVMLDVVFVQPLTLDADRLPANEPGRLSFGLEPANFQSKEQHSRRSSHHDKFPF